MHKTLMAFVLALSLGVTTAPNFLDSIWTGLFGLRNSTKEGGGCDPDGRCLPQHSQSKEGGGWDPNGLTKPDPSDEGGGCDPNGRCSPGS